METLLGVKITHIVAGFCGGIVRAFMVGHSFWAAFSSVIVGALTAGYLTTPVYRGSLKYFPFPEDISTEHAIGFLVGLCAMLICDGIIHAVKVWSETSKLPTKE